jgi:4-diphosphocytidyl-2-C-methyl-D-erythritol kinase
VSDVLRTIAPAKINVALLLGPIRESDGRHHLGTVFQALDLCDDVTLRPRAGTATADEVTCHPAVPGPPEDNLALRALAAFRARTGWDGPPVSVHVEKRIPIAGGMAGGSSDAAAALRLVRAHSGLDLDADALREIAIPLGADVPALVEPGRWLGTGAGEVLEPLPAPADLYGVVVVTSDDGLPTPAVFREADRLGLPRDAAGLEAGLAELRAHAPDLPPLLCVNELEPAALSLRPALRDRLAVLRAAGATVAIVSGSGPTCIGLFDTVAGARAAAPGIGERFPGHVRVCVPSSEGARVG